MRSLGLALVAVLVLASPVQGLTLLDPDPEEPGQLRLRVDQPPLEAQRLAGNLTLEHADLGSELAAIDVPTSSWRGFENVTTLAVHGTGTLLVADHASGLLVHVDPPAEEPGSDEEAHASPADAGTGSGAEATGEENGSQSETASDPSPTKAPGAHEPRSTQEATSEGGQEGGPGLPVGPIPVLLAGLAAGAFLVERLTRAGSKE